MVDGVLVVGVVVVGSLEDAVPEEEGDCEMVCLVLASFVSGSGRVGMK